MSKAYTQFGKYTIYHSDQYFLAYTGGKRNLSDKQEKAWKSTLMLPLQLQIKEQGKLGLENNPNVVPVKGIDIIEIVKERGFIPLFDPDFKNSRLLKTADRLSYECMKAKSYNKALELYK